MQFANFLSVHFNLSRVLFAASRYEQAPVLMSMIHTKFLTPWPAISVMVSTDTECTVGARKLKYIIYMCVFGSRLTNFV